ncbi:MAG TPA: ASCH domain-containing protein [Candidatus Dormibacteraeota bacterium]|jgi:hypothetical protein
MTVRQPWASCIASGHKTVENRGRDVHYRGEIAIHAAKTHDPAGDTDHRVLDVRGRDPRLGAPLGAIIAVADLVDCHDAELPRVAGATCCSPWGDRTYNNGLAWHLVLWNIRRLDRPVSCRGALTIGWTVPGDVEEQVRTQLAKEAAA